MLNLIIEPNTLASQLDNEQLLIIDLRAAENYALGHIPNAINVALTDIVSSTPPVGGLLVNEDVMSNVLSRMGYTEGRHFIIVDDNCGPQAARFAWTLEAYGIESYSVLNGGMVAWETEINVTDNTIEFPTPSHYTASLTAGNAFSREQILAHLGNDNFQVVDARTLGEFNGNDLRSARGGHIPGAIHFEWSQIKDPNTMKLRPLSEIESLFTKASIQKDKTTVTYCQTHMRSSVLSLVMKALEFKEVRGYAGAWSDWGNQEDTPIE